jgi:hypothetical protein
VGERDGLNTSGMGDIATASSRDRRQVQQGAGSPRRARQAVPRRPRVRALR